ncbi:glutamine synthetase, chloroplastic-like [Bidens hawaiensis]|uniref:glutamine synthetase, chloroplastic-like n=1 Tax=Bidens hawaiensis TaxID=980011 RepID=UPI0040499BA0
MGELRASTTVPLWHRPNLTGNKQTEDCRTLPISSSDLSYRQGWLTTIAFRGKHRINKQAGVVLTLDPKPISGNWNGSGCHTCSTITMRDGGFEAIKEAILNLSLHHKEHIIVYGAGNKRRLTGKHETTSIIPFSWGVYSHGCSIHVGCDIEKAGKGYLEDRHHASNMDPYTVIGLVAETTILWEPSLEAEALAAQKLGV